MRRRWYADLVFVLLGVLSLELGFPVAAKAADVAACNGSGTAVYRGYGQNQAASFVDSVQANLDGQSLHHCTPGDGTDPTWSSFAWVAIVPSNGSPIDIIQLGRGLCKDAGNAANCNGAQRYYWAWGRDHTTVGCTGFTDRLPAPQYAGAAGTSTLGFAILGGASTYQFWIGSSNPATLSNSAICWFPNRAEVFTEAWDQGDAVGGTAASHYQLSFMQYRTVTGGAWKNPSWNTSASCNLSFTGTTSPPYHCDIVTSSSIDAWTSR
jgi:hypothetical protein